MLRKAKLRRYTNAGDASLYLNIETDELEAHTGLDREDPSNSDLQYISTALAAVNLDDAKNDQPALPNDQPVLPNNAEFDYELTELNELDDELPGLASSPVLRRTLGFDSASPVENRLMTNSEGELVDGIGLDLRHRSNEDLKPVDEELAPKSNLPSLSIFNANTPDNSSSSNEESLIEFNKK